MEAQLDDLRREIEYMKTRLEHEESIIRRYERQAMTGTLYDEFGYDVAINRYNSLVPDFNRLLAQHNSLADQYEQLVRKINRDVDSYNASIRTRGR